MFKLRLAEEKDIKNLFDLSNDKTVRKNSINKEKIKWYEHVEWFNNRLHKKEPFYIVEDEKENFIGQVRFDNKNDETVISISLVEKYRGKGLASKILKEAVEKSEIKNITAYIYENNHSSIKSFEKAGFKKCSLLKFEYKFNSPEPHNDRGGGKEHCHFHNKI